MPRGQPSEPSKATRAIELAVGSGAQFWHDPDDEPYADVRGDDGVRRTIRIRSRQFRTWLSGVMYAAEGSAIGGQAATDAVDVLTAMAVHKGQERDVHVRIAQGTDRAVYIDLGDDTWRAVAVSAAGWKIVTDPPVRFRRPRALRPLPVPERGGSLEALRALLSLSDDRDWTLLVAWLVGTLHPSGPYPILVLSGEHGTAKTTTGRVLRSLVDPSEAPLRSPPRDDQALILAARNGHIIALDNLSWIPPWLSDALCRIATGGGYSARQLYTDGEEVVYGDRRPILLTSIEDLATRADLADRTILVTLPVISDEARRTEANLTDQLDAIRPGILGALLDAMVVGLTRIDEVQLDRLPRMADFAAWVVACEPALPWQAGAFMEAYDEACKDLVETGIEADLVASGVVAFMNGKSEWKGTALDLLDALNAKRAPATTAPKGWPASPRALSGKVTRAAPNLRRVGIDVERGKDSSGRFFHLTRSDPEGSPLGEERHEGTSERPDPPTAPTRKPDGTDGTDGTVRTGANQSEQGSPPPDLSVWVGEPLDREDQDLLGDEDGVRI